MIHISQHERNDDGVGDDGRQRSQPFVLITQQISAKCTDQRCQAAEDNVKQHAAGHGIADDTSQEKSRYGSRGKYGKNRQGFREADLNGIICQSQSVG